MSAKGIIGHPAPHGKERLKALKERFAHELMDEEARLELREEILRLERKAS